MRGADPSIPDDESETPLLFAARRGYTEIAALLLKDNRTDVNYANSVKVTPFLVACSSGDRSLCEMLLKHGADLTAKSSNLMTGLHFAAFSGNQDTCELLISTGIYLTIIPRARVRYEIVDSQRGAWRRVRYDDLVSNKRQ